MSDEAGEAIEVAGEAGLFKPLEDLLFDAPETETCPNCDMSVYSDETFCESCGTKLPGRADIVDDPGILPTTPKGQEFVGENAPGPHNHFWKDDTTRAVTYLDESERAQLQLFVRDGKLYDADGNLFDTSGASRGKAIWVMDKNGNLYASTYVERGVFHHSSILAGAPVAGAGEISVSDGDVTFLSDKSGHYVPTREYTARVVGHLRSQGLPIDDSQIVLTAKR